MKKILSLILTAVMLMSAFVITTGAEEIGFGEYAPNSMYVEESELTQALDANNVDAQGIYYTLDDSTMTAIVGKNTYSDSASAGVPNTATVVIPATVTANGNSYTVTTIGRNAFDGVDSIVAVAFFGDVIGEFAFAGCTSLEYVYTAASEIKGFAFWGCSALVTADIEAADSIGGGAFWNCGNLQNPVIAASVIMEKAFVGCAKADLFVFLGDAPAVAAGAFDSTAKASIADGAAGYEDFPIETVVRTGAIYDVVDVYAIAGEIVDVDINFATAITAGEYSITITTDDGIEVTDFHNTGVIGAISKDGATVTGTVDSDYLSGAFGTIEITVPEAAKAGTYKIYATVNGVEALAGSVTICDHADTKTVTVKAASCDEAGVANTVCTACGEVISTADVEATGHSYKDFVIAPTCTEGGYTRHICECCADSYTDAETEALGHAWDEGEVIVEASTSKEGQIVYTCTTCGTTNKVIVPKIKYGDANEDTKITFTVASLMLQNIAKWNMEGKTFNTVNADVNCDGKITLTDVTKVLQYIAKWDVKLGPTK